MASPVHQLNGHEFEQTLEDSEGQGSLVCYSPWGCKELDMIQLLNNSSLKMTDEICLIIIRMHQLAVVPE